MKHKDELTKYTATIIKVFAFLIVAAMVVSLLTIYGEITNKAISIESDISRIDIDLENKLNIHTANVKNMANVKDENVEALKEVIKGSFGERTAGYGGKNVLAFMRRNNINFNNKLFLNLQLEMDAGRAEYLMAKPAKIYACREYEELLRPYWARKSLAMAGFPTIDLVESCKVFTVWSDSEKQYL